MDADKKKDLGTANAEVHADAQNLTNSTDTTANDDHLADLRAEHIADPADFASRELAALERRERSRADRRVERRIASYAEHRAELRCEAPAESRAESAFARRLEQREEFRFGSRVGE